MLGKRKLPEHWPPDLMRRMRELTREIAIDHSEPIRGDTALGNSAAVEEPMRIVWRGDDQDAQAFLDSPHPGLGGLNPIAALKTGDQDGVIGLLFDQYREQ